MKIIHIALVFIISTQINNNQTITKKDVVNTEWFSHNKDSLFFQSDTIKLIK